MNRRLIVLIAMAACVIGGNNSPAQTAPIIGLHENTPNVTALIDATVVTAPGKKLEHASIIIRDGVITAVGSGIASPPDAVVRDCNGKTVYPGFIDSYSHYGMPDNPSPGSASLHWNEAVRADIRAAAVFSPDTSLAGEYRASGFTVVAAYPPNGLFRGTGAVVMLDDTAGSRAVLNADAGMGMSFIERSGGYPGSLMGRISLIRQTFLDADWYGRAWKAYTASPENQTPPEVNTALAALDRIVAGSQTCVMESRRLMYHFTTAELAAEYSLDVRLIGSGDEYRRIEELKRTGLPLTVPVNFPDPPDVSTDETTLRELKHWNVAPENPARVAQAGIPFALTANGLDRPSKFLGSLRMAVKRGLDRNTALAAVTTIPAEWLGVSRETGTIAPGKLAGLIVTDGDLFEDGTRILETWVAGKRFEITAEPKSEVRGTWAVSANPPGGLSGAEIALSGDAAAPKAELVVGGKKLQSKKTTLDARILTMAFPADSIGSPGVMRMSALAEGDLMNGWGEWGDGSRFAVTLKRVKAFEVKPDSVAKKDMAAAAFPVTFPDGAYGWESKPVRPEIVVVKNAVVWTSGPAGVLENADIIVKNGKIAEIASDLAVPTGAVVIDAAGKHVTPGLIDAHSHLAVSGGVNEATHSITSETRIRDVIDSDDINIYRQMAGGLTTSCILHGSANSIGGQNEVIKLRWGALPAEMIVPDAVQSIKFALGENVKQSNSSGPPTTRYPRSRMGVEQFMRDSFEAAKDYRRSWVEYVGDSRKNPNLVPPRVDLRYEALLEVLDGNRQVQCHSYR